MECDGARARVTRGRSVSEGGGGGRERDEEALPRVGGERFGFCLGEVMTCRGGRAIGLVVIVVVS